MQVPVRLLREAVLAGADLEHDGVPRDGRIRFWRSFHPEVKVTKNLLRNGEIRL